MSHQAQNDDFGDGISLPVSAARWRADLARLQARHDDRLPPSTCALVWVLLAVAGWGAISLAIYFI